MTALRAKYVRDRAVRQSGVRRKGGIPLWRHRFATQLIERGVERTLVQRVLGHASLLTTIRYLPVTAARLDAAQSPLDLIDLSRLGPPSRN
jgi:site-specific recombinase XerD